MVRFYNIGDLIDSDSNITNIENKDSCIQFKILRSEKLTCYDNWYLSFAEGTSLLMPHTNRDVIDFNIDINCPGILN